jgi:hypothetical protein
MPAFQIIKTYSSTVNSNIPGLPLTIMAGV